MKDALHGAVDTALDPATRARAARSVARGAQQGLSGFNEGLGNVVFAPADALDTATDYVAGKLATAFGTSPPAALPRAHDYYNGAFVAPAGQPETKIEQRIRGAARSFGTDAPALLARWRPGHRGSAFGRDACRARGTWPARDNPRARHESG